MSAGPSVSVLFPMAEQGPRAGYKYRPFIDIGNDTLIEAAVRSFRPHLDAIKEFVFICLEEHEALHQVSQRIDAMFPELPHRVVRLAAPTRGPGATIVAAARQAQVLGEAIICDVDHALDVTPIFKAIRENHADAILPTWNLRGEDLKCWSVAAVSDGRVNGIAEKRLPEGTGEFVGVIGCSFVRSLGNVVEMFDVNVDTHMSNAFEKMIARGQVFRSVPIAEAEFFGEAKKLREARARRDVRVGTIFCDIDGVLVEHEDVPDFTKPLKPIAGSVERLREWADRGFEIVLITARDQAKEQLLRERLVEADVPFHRLVAGLPSGPRFLVNDRKPSAALVPQAVAFEVGRDQGISHLEIASAYPSIRRRFKGGSFAETLLIEDEEKLLVRKRVSKAGNLSLGYSRLKNQYRTMERFSRLSKKLVPALYGEHENSFEYSYDMEFLPNHRAIGDLPIDERHGALAKLLDIVGERVHGTRSPAPVSSGDWMHAHFASKIYPKLDAMQKHPRLGPLVSSAEVYIDGKTYPGLGALIAKAETIGLSALGPNFLCAVHGDLTFENILCNGDDVRVIDMDGSDYFDAPELDFGKLLQSVLTHYESWAHSDETLFDVLHGEQAVRKLRMPEPDAAMVKLCVDHWADVFVQHKDEVYRRGCFFMALHLIRMVPFRLNVSDDQACYALCHAIEWMSKSLEG
ncbi:MAG: NTP transferase domain-containing protein [Sandaracinaceae bacterium]|nr:NTP transferase domain-containing protein [Sandaracinaceae bacterium]